MDIRLNAAIGERIIICYCDSMGCENIDEFDDVEKAEVEISKLYEKEQDRESGVYIRAIFKGIRLNQKPIETTIKIKLEDPNEIKRH